MREIKFRAWDENEYKEMYSWSYIRDENLQELMDAGIILMQYTGLKDKNGVEIYEGDIIQFPNSVMYKVDFYQGSFVYVHKETGYTSFSTGDFYALCEVIGNIYESPELTKM